MMTCHRWAGADIGFAAADLRRDPETDGYFIDNIAVDPAWQARGWGRRLMDHTEREARRHALNAIHFYTNAAMTKNLALYARIGLVETHRAVEHGFSRAFMRRTLGAKHDPQSFVCRHEWARSA